MGILRTMYGGSSGEGDTVASAFDDFNDPLKDVTPEQIRALHNKVLAASQDTNNNLLTTAAGNEFCARHPEYKDTASNGQKMSFAIRKNVGTRTVVTVADYEQAYSELFEAGLLDVDKQKLEAQQRAAAQDRVRDVHGKFVAEQFNEETAYGLDLDEVRRRANEALAR